MNSSHRVPIEALDYRQDGYYYLDGKPFTGIGYSLFEDGRVAAEMEYREGLQDGRTREWYATGQMMVDSTLVEGGVHGHAREWHVNGVMAEDGEYDHGVALWTRKWDEQGKLVKEYVLSPTDPRYEAIQRRLAQASCPRNPPKT